MRANERTVRVRKSAVQALGKVGEKGVESLLEFFRDADESVRHYASEILGEVGGDRAADKCSSFVVDKDPLVRAAALRGMGKLGESGLLFSPLIAEHLWDNEFPVRLA